MKKIKEDMDTANKFIKEYYQEVKETFVNKLKQAIEDIEEAYETNRNGRSASVSFYGRAETGLGNLNAGSEGN